MKKAFLSWNLCGACLILATSLCACSQQANQPVGELLQAEGLRIDENRITSTLLDGKLDVSLVLERSIARRFFGTIEAELVDLEDKSHGKQALNFDLQQDEASYHLTLRTPADMNGLSDMSKYVLEYRVGFFGHRLYGKRSLFTSAQKMEVQVMAASRLYDGEDTFLRVLARNPHNAQALSEADVTVALEFENETITVGSGRTDASGVAEVLLGVPLGKLGSANMVVSVRSTDGVQEKIAQNVEVLREEKILLTTDKPIYQPGQTMKLRALSLRRPALKPVNDEEVLFEITDGKGNKVFKLKQRTNAFGIASADFHLASEVNMGAYNLSAQLGTTKAVKTVQVKRYALPKFNVRFILQQGYFLPGQTVSGQIDARYFFGKPISGGSYQVVVSTYDVELHPIGTVSGVLDQEGLAAFSFALPTHFVGIDLLQGDAYLQFDVEVTDLAQHTEKATVVSKVAQAALKLDLIPESGDLVPGVPNTVHVVTADPIGQPVSADVSISADNMDFQPVRTDERGLAQIVCTPTNETTVFHVSAIDDHGNSIIKDVRINSGQAGQTLLLRVDKHLAQVGDTLHLTALSNDVSDRIYLDVIKGNQTLLTHSLDLTNGQAQLELEATPDMVGNVQFDAYYLTRDSQIIRDSQLVLVEGASHLNLEVTFDKKIYLTAETAKIDLAVTQSDGTPVQAALGLSVVDEAVFALTEFRPGLAETFFEIEQDVITPRVQIIASSVLDDYLDQSLDEEQRQTSAEIAFSAAKGFSGYGILQNTYTTALQTASQAAKMRMDQDVKKIAEYLASMAEMGLLSEENLPTWLQKMQDHWFDPFGKPYRIELQGNNQWDWRLFFHSNGPDEVAKTADDIRSAAIAVWRILERKEGDTGGWDDIGVGDGAWDEEMDDGPIEADPADNVDQDSSADSAEQESSGPPRVRSYFPETLYFNPALITDDNGQASLEIPLADSITTWRMTSLANTLAGQIGSRADGITVFQDFFIDIDFPTTLTQADQVSVPVAIYNYLDVPQTISIEVQPEEWFTLLDAGSKSISLEAGQVGVIYFTLSMEKVGMHGLTVMGYGNQQSDAVRRMVQVVPNGQEVRQAQSDRLAGQLSKTVSIPVEAIDGASRIFVKIYPGLMSQAVEGLDSILRIPNGCFEQTTSSAWPNIMVLNYLQDTNQFTPAIELKARDYVNMGYQRILTFECPSGGFNWWVGDDPGNTILASMALMMFSDAKRAVDLDMDVIGRTQNFLAAQQRQDGSWSGEAHLHAGNEVLGTTELRASAFCTWGLSMSEYTGAAVDQGAAYLRQAVDSTDDTYSQALTACALAWHDSSDPALDNLLAKLDDKKQLGDAGTVHWSTPLSTVCGGYGSNGDIETTALVIQAMIKAGAYPELIQGAITWLIQQKDSFGTWYTTQPTVQSLRAMSMAMSMAASQNSSGTIQIGINGVGQVCSFDITPDNADLTRICELDAHTTEGDNQVSISLDGEGTLMYQVVGVYYLPWSEVEQPPGGPLSISVNYDRTQLAVDETVTVNVEATYNIVGEKASMVMIDLGIPPGFVPLVDDLTNLVQNHPHITRFELRGRQLSIYVDEISHGQPLTFQLRMRAKYPIQGQAPESKVWAYYNPDQQDTSKPVTLVVTE